MNGTFSAMQSFAWTRWRRALLLTAVGVLAAGSAQGQVLPWEVTVAEIEAGRLRGLAQRLSKQNLLYQFRLGDVRKTDLIKTAGEIDTIIDSLEHARPAHSIPAPWTNALRKQLLSVDRAWGPLRRIAIASPYDYIRHREFVPLQTRRDDPILVGYFDDLSDSLIDKSENLLAAYHAECLKTGLEVCPVARTSGYAAMVIERAAKEAVYVVAGIEPEENRRRLQKTIAAYHEVRRANDQSPFFAVALDPERGVSARAAAQLLDSLREDWDALQNEFNILEAGDEKNFDLPRMLGIHARLVEKVERLSAALVRYASLAYGG